VAVAANLDHPLDQWYPLLDKGVHSKLKSKKERGQVRVIISFRDIKAKASDVHASTASVPVPASTSPSASPSTPSHHHDSRWWEIDFNEIHLEKELGRGAFGIVYRGKWRLQDTAVKLLLNQQMTAKELEEFRAESTLMMDLRPHRNLVPLLGACTDPAKKLCLVTDFIEGGSLETLLKSKVVFSWKLVLDIGKGITAGVYHLHRENILHRDLAARNILLRANYEPLIADFGLSKKVDALPGVSEADNKQVKTVEKDKLRGPYKWMAPESLARNEFSIKSDAWSFGVVLYEMITRSEPFPTMDIFTVANLVTTQGLKLQPPPSTPHKFGALMTWCFASRPEDRPDFLQISQSLAAIEPEVGRY